ncbi:hypothetical protein ABPG74_022102, partial [Tetrahymena malaccensis]
YVKILKNAQWIDNYQATQSIVDDLRIIQTAKRYVPQLLDEITTSINNFEINLQEIQKTIYSKIKSFYEKIIVFINIHQFYEAEIKIELLESILQVLGDQNSEQKIKVQQLHDIKVKELKNVTDQFINIELDKEEYLKNPPKKILEQLQKCDNKEDMNLNFSSDEDTQQEDDLFQENQQRINQDSITSNHNSHENLDQQQNIDQLKQFPEQRQYQNNLNDESKLESEIPLKSEENNQIQNLQKTDQLLQRKQSQTTLTYFGNNYEEHRQAEGDEMFSKLNDLQKQLQEGLKQLELQDVSQLEEEIYNKKELIQKLENQNRTQQVLLRKESLQKLQSLLQINEEMIQSQGGKKKSKFDDLQQQSQEGSQIERQISEKQEQLNDQISQKQEQIQLLENQNRTEQALDRKKSLEKLQNLLIVYENLIQSQGGKSQIKIDDLQKQLEEGLDQLELQDGSQLKDEISYTQQEIQKLEYQNRTKQVLQKKKSLEKLQKLQIIYEVLIESQSEKKQSNLLDLEQQLKEGLGQLELQDGSQLETEIQEKKEKIKQLEIQKRTNQVLERKKSLEKIENLNKIYCQLQELRGGEQNSNDQLINQKLQQILTVQEYDEFENVEENVEQNNESNNDQQVLNDLNMKKLIEASFDIKQDIENYPECAEKLLLKLICDIATLIGEMPQENDETRQSDICKQLETLQDQLKLEGLLNVDVKKQISEIYTQIKSWNWQQAASKVQKLLKQLRPLNVGELKRLIDKTIEAKKLIKNQDILLFLGGTGSGKSTSIHFLAGSPMKELQINIKGGHILKYIGPVISKIQRQELKNIKVSPYAESETRYISPVQLNYKDIGMIKDGSIMLCDAPGFGDTAGPEVDIANGIGMVNAIRGCKSVRPVILASNLSIGDRGEGIRRLAHTLVGLIKKVDDYLYSFSYLFTKFNDKNIEQIAAQLQNILSSIHKNAEENSDQQFVSLFEDMVEKAQHQKGGQKIEPLNGKPQDYLKELIKKKPIENPGEVFEISISEKSNSTIHDQVNLHKQSIISAMKRSDYLLIKYKLDDMYFLIETLGFTYLKQTYEESVNYVKDNLMKDYNQITEDFNRNLKKNNKLDIEDVKQYQNCVNQFQQIDKLRKDHLGNDVLSSDSLIQNLIRQIEEIYQQLDQESIYEYNSQKNNFDNFKLLSQEFPLLEEKYQKLCRKLQDIQAQILNEAENALKSNDYIQFSTKLLQIKQQIIFYAEYCNVDNLQQKYNNIIQSLIDHLYKIINQVDYLLKNDFDQECQQNIKVIIQNINDVKETYELREHIKIENIQQIIQDLNDKIFKKFDNICYQIEEVLKNETESTFKDIEGLIDQLTLIRDIQSNQEKIQEKYHQTTQNVYGKMQQIRRDTEMLLSTFYQSPQSVNYEKVYRYVNQLKNSQWMDSIRKDSYKNLMQTISDDLTKHALTLSEQLLDMDLDLSSQKNLEQAWNYVSQIQSMRSFEQTIGQLTKYREIAEHKFNKSTEYVFDFIQKKFNVDSKAVHMLKIQQQKLKNIKKEYDNPPSVQNYFQKYNIIDISQFQQSLEQQENELQSQQKNLTQVEEDQNIDYKVQIQTLQLILSEYNELDDKLEKSQNKNSKNNKKLQNKQKELLAQSKYQNIEDLKIQLQTYIKHREQKQDLEKQLQQLKEKKDIFDSYTKLINSNEFQSEQEGVLKNYGFQNLQALEKEIESIELNIKNSQNLNQDYVFDKLDGQIAENSLNYLEASKKIRSLKEEANKTLLDFNNYMKKYEENITDQLNRNFQYIKNLNEEKTGDAFKYAQQIAASLQEIQDLQSYKKVFDKVKGKEIINTWRKNLTNNLIELRDQMSQCAVNQQNIKKHLDIARALIQIDFFINEENNYFLLYKQYQAKVNEGLREIFLKIIKLIDNHEFQSVATELLDAENQPKNQKAFEQIKHNINVTVDELCEITKSKSIQLALNNEYEKQIQRVNEISQNLKKILQAKKHVSKYLNEISQDNLIRGDQDSQDTQRSNDKLSSKYKMLKVDLYLEQIKQIIQNKISNYIKSIQALINGNAFDEAENKRENIHEIQQIISDLCLDQKITDEIENLQNTIETNVENIVEKFLQMDQEEYILNPPKQILEKLEKVAQRSIRYQNSLCRTKEQILQKIRTQIKEIKNKQSGEREEAIQKIEQILHFLPVDMKDYIAGELRQQKDFLLKQEQQLDDELNKIKQSKDAQQLKEILIRCENNKMESFKQKVTLNAFEICNQYKTNIEKLLGEEQIQIKQVVESSRKIVEFQEQFEVYEILNIYNDIQQKIQQKMIKCFVCMLGTSNLENVGQIKNKYQTIINFIQVQHESKMTQSINLNSYIESLFLEFSKHFNKNQEKLDKSLSKLDMKQIEESLVFIEKKNDILQEIKRSESILKPKDADKFENEDFQMIIRCKNYEESKDCISEKLLVVLEQVLNFELQKGSENEKMEYYKQIEMKLQILEYTKKLKKHFQPEKFDIYIYENEAIPQITTKIKSIVQDIYKLTQKNEPLTKLELENLRISFENTHCFTKQVKTIKFDSELQNQINSINNCIKNKVEQYAYQINPCTEISVIANCLIQMKRIGDNLYFFKSDIDQLIDSQLSKYRNANRNDGGQSIGKLSVILESESDGVGQIILSEHSIFKGQAISIFNQKTQRHDIDYVLGKIQGDNLNKIRLQTMFDQIQQGFQDIIKHYVAKMEKKEINQANAVKELVSLIKQERKQAKNGKLNWDGETRNTIPKLIYLIFSLWSLLDISYYSDNSSCSQDKRSDFILQPHPGQIISILRILGLGYIKEKDTRVISSVKKFFDYDTKNDEEPDDQLKNNLIEIGTGEGKSVTLAVTACILVLLGANVSCACYSQYLSQRDYDSFLPIFVNLGITENIQYGAFTQICEQFINEQGEVRNRVIKLIENKSEFDKNLSKRENRPRILLIDEVDIFFSPQFYGNVYTPLARLKHPTIEQLTDYIWQKRKSNLTFIQLKNSSEFQNCCKQFIGWQNLLEEALKDMIADLQNYEHEYEITIDGRIGYKEQDGISFNISFGYKTLFAHYKEYENGKISKTTLSENIFIGIRCGSFSYAEIPNNFQFIMGVTGTLRSLTNYEKNIVENVYNIKHKTFIPSVFGENKRKFSKKEDVYIENKDNYYKTLMEQIIKKIDKRAVLVFFENQETLKAFHASKELACYEHQTKLITEQVSKSLKEKNMLINNSTTSGQITLISRIFGRGTDFICRDQTVIQNGGTHVISTFFSDDISEEIQIFGRTARQGQEGSVSLVLLESDLEKFLGSNYNQQLNSMRAQNNFYEKLNEKREKQVDSKYKDTNEFISQAKKEHINAERFLQALNKGQKDFIINHLIEQNKGASIVNSNISRTICLMDATGSMGSLLTKVKDTVETMFQRASIVLQENNIQDECFQMQFVVYRDYDCLIDGILQFSPWESKPISLREFIKTINAHGGGDFEEAIEIGLQHANTENSLKPISQVILIGDAPSKSNEAIKRDRNQYRGESYWEDSKFSEITHYKTEAFKLKLQSIPVHCFYLNESAQQNFQEISDITQGRCQKLDINSPNGSQQLTDVITESILESIGGQQLVKSYQKIFGKKSYS